MLRIVAFSLFVALAFAAPRWHQLEASRYSYEDFVAEFNRPDNTTNDFFFRREIFEQNLEKIMAHNRDATKTWKLGVNKFADRTPEELRRMLGYHKGLGYRAVAAANPIPYKKVDLSALPAAVDWRTKSAVSPVKDQGGCGSCWTFAAAEILESHYYLKTGKLMELSEQQIASCTPNPKHCGGTGGCQGGTAQIAYDAIKSMGGIQSEWTYPYESYQGENFQCKFVKQEVAAKVSGYTQLPNNEYAPLLDAVANVGPIAISVDASAWSFYETGVFDGCNQTTPDVNHAVALIGYGTEDGHDYWLVRNSWSPNWGENGYIRIKRSSTPECGTDVTPEHGSGCDGGPATVKACGACAILFDSCYPNIA